MTIISIGPIHHCHETHSQTVFLRIAHFFDWRKAYVWLFPKSHTFFCHMRSLLFSLKKTHRSYRVFLVWLYNGTAKCVMVWYISGFHIIFLPSPMHVGKYLTGSDAQLTKIGGFSSPTPWFTTDPGLTCAVLHRGILMYPHGMTESWWWWALTKLQTRGLIGPKRRMKIWILNVRVDKE